MSAENPSGIEYSTDKEVRLRKKISTEKFVNLLAERPERIIIPRSILDQSKNLKLIVKALSFSYSSPEVPEIEISARGEESTIITRDEIDPFVRKIVGYVPNARARLLMKLLASEATRKENAVNLSDLTRDEVRIARVLKSFNHIDETDDMKIYLTELGETTAKGAQKMYQNSPGDWTDFLEEISTR